MTDSIERHIADLQLPEPTPELDRRIDELLSVRPQSKRPKTNGRFGVLVLAGSSLAAGMLGVAFRPPPSDQKVNTASRPPETPVVETIELSIPLLDLPPTNSVNDQDRLFPAGTIVVTTSIQKEE